LRKIGIMLLAVIVLGVLLPTTQAQDETPTTLRILIFEDGNSVDVLEGITNDYEADNPDVVVEIDVLPFYSEITEILEDQIAAGTPPDLVRVTELGRFSEHYLDVRPFLSNADEWDDNFAPELLQAMRTDPTSDTLHGYPTDFTISGPFINRTLFEDAGVEVPSDTSDEVTWEAWETATRAVQEALSTEDEPIYGMLIDRSGHRFWGPSLSLCATYFDRSGSGNITIDSEGFRTTANMLYDWHVTGLTALDVWAAPGQQYIDPGDIFEDGRAAFHFSGSWKVSDYQEIDDFDWEVVPSPVGPCGSSGMVGGGVIVAMAGTQHPQEVGDLLSYLTQVETMERFYGEALYLPGHSQLIESGIDYPTNAAALNTFTTELGKVNPEAYELQYNSASGEIHSLIRVRLSQVMSDELTLDEAFEGLQADLDTLLSE
jgi:alpha-1,4-digalacturonate transport system substrate-binding protein